ncbi:DNA repair protein RadA/Sms [Acetitomaculum ruminis DSM 5522]|uniref:DNA repair protein RadA n=1 Tax=Acetitomaculum ruminis DSM 5522 TaxID=1120918 RepID=A0A1I0Z5H1_9FIRM|nr:DNA repair protein RadA [Acetitomaculum ruminis]SFB20597.1 DNA repair protein RadA/Sms [Acetitomaculum ruminis DSM 5522]
MARKKEKTVFFCKECGHESTKWLGQCPGCGQWNTFVEEVIKNDTNLSGEISSDLPKTRPTKLKDVNYDEFSRTSTKMEELDRVLGGGIVKNSLILLGGDPGIGKSTLLLQVCKNLANQDKKVLYVSGEESLQQIKMRAERLGDFSKDMYLYCETDLSDVSREIINNSPDFVVIDSIQTMYNANVTASLGSVSQIRESTGILMRLAKEVGTTIVIVGHVTKEGTVAGPRVLEHMVDTVLYFEGDRYASYRVLRSVKNRFGSTNEVGVFEMNEDGLRQVNNPSEYMLSGRPENATGSIASCSMEGSRPILLEVQALICETSFQIPQRTANGIDLKRVNLLMAVLEKRARVKMSFCDAYVNIAGGLKIKEPAIDLGIALAMYSSFKNIPIDEKLVAFGEIGLSGEVRMVNMAEQRVLEAKKLGFEKVILPETSANSLKKISGIKIIGVKDVSEAIKAL